MLKITLIKSRIGLIEKQQSTLEALGLRKIGKVVMKKEDKAILGMIKKVPHLISVEKVKE